ncbi:MAG: SH3 domain-containing protein [Clostridia bacterium]|nr:SH3 domain-containing protein [Clostridia bacterium]
MKKGLALIMALILVLALVPASLADGQENAVAWAQDRLNEGWMEDYDLENGCQDVDLIKYYFDYLGEQPINGYASAYVNAPLPSGWTRSLVPKPGDIVVWGANVGIAGQYGHIGIVTGVNSNRITYIATNDGATRVTSHEISRYSCSCYIHPVFKEFDYSGYTGNTGYSSSTSSVLEICWLIDGQNISGAQNAGTVDVYINGAMVANDVNFVKFMIPVGSYYEIRDIKAINGYRYDGIASGSTIGLINGDSVTRLIFNSAGGYTGNTGYTDYYGGDPNVTIKSSGKLTDSRSAAQHAQPKVPQFTGRVIIIDDNAPLRSSASSSASQLATLTKETGLEYLEYKKDSRDVVWYKVLYEKQITEDTTEVISGWVSSKKATFRGYAVNHTAGEQIVVVDGQEWIREEPNLLAEDLDVAYCASRWTFAGEGAVDERGIEWYKIEYKKQTAWISSLYSMFVKEYSGELSWKQGGLVSASGSISQNNPPVDAARAFDSVSYTAWAAADTRNCSVGQWIQLKLGNARSVNGFYIVNGYNKILGNTDVWEKHSRVKTLEVYCDNSLIGTYELYDTREEQYVSFGSPRYGTTFRFVIRDVYAVQNSEACITEITMD